MNPKLGFKTLIQPSPKGVKRHSEETLKITRQYVGAPQAALINQLNPIIRGWTHYYRASVAKRIFNKLDKQQQFPLLQVNLSFQPESRITRPSILKPCSKAR